MYYPLFRIQIEIVYTPKAPHSGEFPHKHSFSKVFNNNITLWVSN